jgi:hypothetical protein
VLLAVSFDCVDLCKCVLQQSEADGIRDVCAAAVSCVRGMCVAPGYSDHRSVAVSPAFDTRPQAHDTLRSSSSTICPHITSLPTDLSVDNGMWVLLLVHPSAYM